MSLAGAPPRKIALDMRLTVERFMNVIRDEVALGRYGKEEEEELVMEFIDAYGEVLDAIEQEEDLEILQAALRLAAGVAVNVRRDELKSRRSQPTSRANSGTSTLCGESAHQVSET